MDLSTNINISEPKGDSAAASAGERRKLTRAAGVVGLATLASRVGGFVRDLVVAYFFGAGPAADAFFVAFRIPNLLRRLLAEGALTVAFIPVFTEELAKKGRDEAFMLARSTFGLLGLALLLICGLGVVFSPQVVRAMAPGWPQTGPSFELAVELTRWCLPYIFFVSLTALASGVLNSLDHFFAPAASPVLLNLCLIASAAVLARRVDPPVLSLAVGVILGGLCQLLLQLPYLKARGVRLAPAWDWRNPALRRVLRLMGPAAFGAAIYQLTVFINTVLASLLASGSVSYLYYADRLIEFPLGIFAIAISTAVLPSLSRQAAAGDHEALKTTMAYGLRLTMFINLPAMAGLMVLARPFVLLLFTRGQFSLADAEATAAAVMGYGAGLWAFAALRGVLPAFYALKDTRTPVKVGAVCVVINVGLSLALMDPLKHVGLALATSLTSAANLGMLLWLLRRRLGRLGGREVLTSALRCGLAALVMAGVVWAVVYLPDWGPLGGFWRRLVRPLAGLGAGLAAYLALAWVMRLRELRELMQVVRRR
ncbi:MAG: murein biosynthesis integral membrane protein MurJ [Pseudomonadota bacterium]